MGGLGTLLVLGIVMYFLFSRNSGVGCCGAHSHHSSQNGKPDHSKTQGFAQKRENENIIDLKPDEYKVLSESHK